MNVRVGPTIATGLPYPLTQAQANLARVLNRWADTVFLENGTVNLVEAKMRPDPGIFSKLVHCARKLRLDPTWSAYASWPMNLIAVVAADDPSVAMEAPFYRVQWVVYQPSFLTSDQTQASGVGTPISPVPLPQDYPARLDLLNINKVV